jgi:hypothetical protein
MKRNGDEGIRGAERGGQSGDPEALVRSAVSKARAGQVERITLEELMSLKTLEPSVFWVAMDIVRTDRDPVVWLVGRYVPMRSADVRRGFSRGPVAGRDYILTGIESAHLSQVEAIANAILLTLEYRRDDALFQALGEAATVANEDEAHQILWRALVDSDNRRRRPDPAFRLVSLRLSETRSEQRDYAREALARIGGDGAGPVLNALRILAGGAPQPRRPGREVSVPACQRCDTPFVPDPNNPSSMCPSCIDFLSSQPLCDSCGGPHPPDFSCECECHEPEEDEEA